MLDKSNSSSLTPEYKPNAFSPMVTNVRSCCTPSSFTDSTYRDSIGDFRKRTMLETDFPLFKRSKSMKRYHISSSFIDGIKEEINEDDSTRLSCYSFNRRKFSPFTVMPKDDVLLFDAKPKNNEITSLLTKEIMDPVPEIEDDNLRKDDLFLKSPRIKLQSDITEDNTIIPLKPLTVRSAPVNETDIIKEEKENQNGYEIVRSKYEHFIDKEEPPAKDVRDVQGFSLHYEDAIKEAGIEEEQQMEVKDFMLKKKSSMKKFEVCADEIDEKKIDTIPTIFGKMSMEEVINESDEYPN